MKYFWTKRLYNCLSNEVITVLWKKNASLQINSITNKLMETQVSVLAITCPITTNREYMLRNIA